MGKYGWLKILSCTQSLGTGRWDKQMDDLIGGACCWSVGICQSLHNIGTLNNKEESPTSITDKEVQITTMSYSQSPSSPSDPVLPKVMMVTSVSTGAEELLDSHAAQPGNPDLSGSGGIDWTVQCVNESSMGESSAPPMSTEESRAPPE